MLFNSLEFIIFIFLCFPLYWLGAYWLSAKRGNVMQNITLIVASCVFYAWVDWKFLFLIALTAFLTYFSSLRLSNKNKRKTLLVLNIVVNLIILGFFKYYNFFAESFSSVFSCFGLITDALIFKINLVL